MPRIEKPCEICGKIVSRRPSQMTGPKRGHTFCGRTCYGVWRAREFVGERHRLYNRTTLPCVQCGVIVYRTASQRRHENVFCGFECKGKWQSEHLVGEKHPSFAGGPPTFLCAWCGLSVRRYTSSTQPTELRFCNEQCHGKWRSKNLVGERNMHWKGGRPQIQCDGCGSIFKTTASNLKNYKHHFCGSVCRGKWISLNMAGSDSPQWKGGWSSYYGPNWNAQQRSARKRDGYKCRHCGKTQKQNKKALDVHHIKPFREFGYVVGQNENYLQANDLTNLITLCPKCHKKAENGRIPIQPYLL